MSENITAEETFKLEVNEVQLRAIVELVCRADKELDYDPPTSAIVRDGSLLVSLLHQQEKQLAKS